MDKKSVAIIGGGVAGIEAASILSELGYLVNLYEKEPAIGGHTARWDRLFPNQRLASEVINSITTSLKGVNVNCLSKIEEISRKNGAFEITTNGEKHLADAVVIATGFELFPAEQKEEYGYGIFENIITSADLEKMFKDKGKPTMVNGHNPSRIAFIHCVGSRDEKVNRPYCSKVCCVTAVKQAIEVKESIPNCEVYCFYMDLRMFGPGYEDLYKHAQNLGVNFIRGRLSETSETKEGKVLIKAEDTLLSKPLKMSVDMVVLMVGMSPVAKNSKLLENLSLKPNTDGFIQVKDYHTEPTQSVAEGVFLAGACTGPNNITDSINAARSAVIGVHNYLSGNIVSLNKKSN
jgi:heterodisulfide reductase subunit A2